MHLINGTCVCCIRSLASLCNHTVHAMCHTTVQKSILCHDTQFTHSSLIRRLCVASLLLASNKIMQCKEYLHVRLLSFSVNLEAVCLDCWLFGYCLTSPFFLLFFSITQIPYFLHLQFKTVFSSSDSESNYCNTVKTCLWQTHTAFAVGYSIAVAALPSPLTNKSLTVDLKCIITDSGFRNRKIKKSFSASLTLIWSCMILGYKFKPHHVISGSGSCSLIWFIYFLGVLLNPQILF